MSSMPTGRGKPGAPVRQGTWEASRWQFGPASGATELSSPYPSAHEVAPGRRIASPWRVRRVGAPSRRTCLLLRNMSTPSKFAGKMSLKKPCFVR